MKLEAKSVFIYSRGAQVAEKALERIARERIIGIVIAAAGCSKTYSITHWSRQQEKRPRSERQRHLIVEATLRTSARPLLAGIAQGLGLQVIQHAETWRMAEAIARELAHDPVTVIVDEADGLTVPAFEKLRGVWDLVAKERGEDGDHAFPLALFGTERLRRLLEREDLERLRSRVGEIDEMPAMSLDELADAVRAKWPALRCDDEGLGELYARSHGSFRWLNRLVPIAYELAAKDGKTVTARTVERGARYLLGAAEES